MSPFGDEELAFTYHGRLNQREGSKLLKRRNMEFINGQNVHRIIPFTLKLNNLLHICNIYIRNTDIDLNHNPKDFFSFVNLKQHLYSIIAEALPFVSYP